jgi:hypothetical protein
VALSTMSEPDHSPGGHTLVAATQVRHIGVQFALTYTGGDYSDTGYDTAYIPEPNVAEYGVEDAFRRFTGHDPVHIIFYESTLRYTAEGEELPDDGETGERPSRGEE